MCPLTTEKHNTKPKISQIKGDEEKYGETNPKATLIQKKSVEIASKSNYFEQTDTVLNKRITLIMTNNILPDFIEDD